MKESQKIMEKGEKERKKEDERAEKRKKWRKEKAEEEGRTGWEKEKTLSGSDSTQHSIALFIVYERRKGRKGGGGR